MDGLIYFLFALVLAITTKQNIIEPEQDERQIKINTTGYHDDNAFMKHYNIIVQANGGLSGGTK